MHIVYTIANNSSVPYFIWFARKNAEHKKFKFSFILLCKEFPALASEVKQYDCTCYWIKYDSSYRKSSIFKAFFKLFFLFKKLNPDVIHAHLFDDSLPALLAGRLLRIKKRVITKQDTTFHWFYAPKGIIFDRLNNRNATHIVAVSEECKQFILEKEKASREKITTIHHGIPPEIFTKQSEEYKNELIQKYQLEGKKIIGTVARLIEWKGYRYIIEAIPEVIKKYPNALFLFVGQGDQKEELEQLAKKLNVLQYVMFTGWVDRKYIPSLYALLDVYAHAANYEPFGFVIPEAMMNAAPVVSTPTGSALDAIQHKLNGYLVKYKDAASMSEGICYTLDHGTDFKEAGRKTALEKYNFDLMWQSYIQLYKKT